MGLRGSIGTSMHTFRVYRRKTPIVDTTCPICAAASGNRCRKITRKKEGPFTHWILGEELEKPHTSRQRHQDGNGQFKPRKNKKKASIPQKKQRQRPSQKQISISENARYAELLKDLKIREQAKKNKPMKKY